MGQRSLLSVYFLAILLTLMTGCGQSTSSGSSSATPNACDKASSIKGSIASISHESSGNLMGNFLLDGIKENQAQFDKVYVNVESSTQVFEKQQDGCQTLLFSDLKPGQRVQVQSTGTTALSSPPQIQATEIVVLPPNA
jgi:hypothetical protein